METVARYPDSYYNMFRVLLLRHCGHTEEPVLTLWSHKTKAFWIPAGHGRRESLGKTMQFADVKTKCLLY